MKTYGQLYKEIDRSDHEFIAFCQGWDAAVRLRGVDLSTFSQAQEAQLWGLYTNQIEVTG